MSNDDSFNDGDETFSLYSSKKVMDTFKAQLKKIAANNHLINATSHANNETIYYRNKRKNQNSDCQFDNDKEEATPIGHKSTEPDILVIDESPATPVYSSCKIKDNNSVENSVKVITVTSKTRTRQSERLKNKNRDTPNCAEDQIGNINQETPVNRKVTRSKTKALKEKKQQKKPVEVTLEDSPQQTENDDELNPEVSVKVIWKSVNVKKFVVRKFQKLSYVFKQLSEEEHIPQDKIILTFNGVRVNHNDTPDSLKLQVFHFLDGGVLSKLSNLCETPNSLNSDCDDESVTIKFQDVYKKIIKIKLNKNEKLQVGMIKCSEQLDIPLNKIKFLFDGESLNPSETPASLGLEDGEIVDIEISN